MNMLLSTQKTIKTTSLESRHKVPAYFTKNIKNQIRKVNFMTHEICMVCRDKNRNDNLDALQRLQTFLIQKNIDLPRKHATGREISRLEQNLTLEINKRCKYGMFCPSIDQKNRECQILARKLAPIMITYLDKGYNRHELLEQLRGYFPMAYRYVEQYRPKQEKQAV